MLQLYWQHCDHISGDHDIIYIPLHILHHHDNKRASQDADLHLWSVMLVVTVVILVWVNRPSVMTPQFFLLKALVWLSGWPSGALNKTENPQQRVCCHTLGHMWTCGHPVNMCSSPVCMLHRYGLSQDVLMETVTWVICPETLKGWLPCHLLWYRSHAVNAKNRASFSPRSPTPQDRLITQKYSQTTACYTRLVPTSYCRYSHHLPNPPFLSTMSHVPA